MLLSCRCGAKHNPAIEWVTGRHGAGTDGAFYVTGSIKPGHCPFCRRPPVVADRNPVPRDWGCM